MKINMYVYIYIGVYICIYLYIYIEVAQTLVVAGGDRVLALWVFFVN